MRPAVPPEFRLKANTLTAYNGAYRIRLCKAFIRSAPKGNAHRKLYIPLPAVAVLSVIRIFQGSLHHCIYTLLVYHIFKILSSTFIKL